MRSADMHDVYTLIVEHFDVIRIFVRAERVFFVRARNFCFIDVAYSDDFSAEAFYRLDMQGRYSPQSYYCYFHRTYFNITKMKSK